MKTFKILSLGLLIFYLSCSTEPTKTSDNYAVEYSLKESFNFTGFFGNISGIDFDGQWLWIVTNEPVGGYYDNNKIRIYKYDVTNSVVDTSFYFDDDNAPPRGITVSNDNLWVNFTNSSASKIKKINKNSGEITQVFWVGNGIEDLTSDSENIFFSYSYNKIEKVNSESLSLINTFQNPFGEFANFGIAYRQDEIWLTCRFDKQIVVIDQMGEQLGRANIEALTDWNDFDPRICFMHDQLVLVKNPRIHVFDIINIR